MKDIKNRVGVGDLLQTSSSTSRVKRKKGSIVENFLRIMFMMVFMIVAPLPLFSGGNAEEGDTVVVCSNGSYGAVLDSRFTNMRSKLTNTALFGAGGEISESSFIFKNIVSVEPTTDLLTANDCDIWFSGYDYTSDGSFQDLQNFVDNGGFVMAGCDTAGVYDAACEGVGFPVVNYSNIPVIATAPIATNPLSCDTDTIVLTTAGGASSYFTSGVSYAEYNDGSGLPEIITDSITDPKVLLTGDINMWDAMAGVTAGGEITSAQDRFVVNSWKFAIDAVTNLINKNGGFSCDKLTSVPIGMSETVSTTPNTLVNIDVLTNDTDLDGNTLSITNLTQPSNGSVVINGTTIDYTPNVDFKGTDTFTYTPNNGTEDGSVVTVTVIIDIDSDNDGVVNQLDLDDDNDGILDTDEGTGDIDGDGIPNHLDLDSDGDGCSDAYEFGSTTNLTKNFSFSDVNVGSNGLEDSLEVSDETNTTINYSPLPYAYNATIKSCLDTDNDGIADLVDIDDDNDGVLDAVESPSCFYAEADVNSITVTASDIVWHTSYPLANAKDDNIATFTQTNPVNQAITDKVIVEYILATALKVESLKLEMGAYSLSTNASTGEMKLQGWNGTVWKDLSITRTSSVVNSTETFSNTLDTNGTFSKLRLYGVSGTLYYARINESSIVLKDFNTNLFPKETCTEDTDGDGIYNHLDLDSDGDSCSDMVESASGILTASTTTGDVGENGFSDNLETSVDSGIINYTATDFAYSAALNACADTDGDGIGDIVDLDDDNDGILDIDEKGDCNAAYDIGNSDFSQLYEGFDTDILLANSSVNGIPAAGKNDWYGWDTKPGVRTPDGGYFMLFNDPADLLGRPALFWRKTVNVTPDTDLNFIMDFIADGAFLDFKINGNSLTDGPKLYDTGTTPGDYSTVQWTEVVIPFTTGATDTTVVFEIYAYSNTYAPSTSTVWGDGALDNFRINIQGTCDGIDTDNDGIKDYLDLDSDNDGIPDNIEAQTTVGYIAPGTVDENGTFANYTPIDTDGDGVADYLDTDSDDDNISDVDESGLTLLGTDANNDGIDDGVHASYTDVNGDVNTPSVNLLDMDSISDDDAEPDYRDVDADYEAPVLGEDNVTVESGDSITIDVLGNDTDIENDIDISSVQIVGTTNIGDDLVVPNEGTWSVEDNGSITFTPEVGFTADPTPIEYVVSDNTGEVSDPIAVNLDYPQTAPVVVDDSVDAQTGQPITVNVLENDSDAENDINVSAVEIVGGTDGVLEVANEGTWEVNATNGAITFTPETGFTGDPTPISYIVTDNTGEVSNEATLSVDYIQPPAIEVIDTKTTTNVETNETRPEMTGTCEANATVTIQIDGVAIDPTTVCTEAGTFVIVPSAPIAEAEHNVTTSQVADDNRTSPISPVKVLTVDIVNPDYIPTLDVRGTVVTTQPSNLDFVVRVGEFNGGENVYGDVNFSIVKSEGFVLSFDATKTTQQEKSVENNLWELSETATNYTLTYVGNGKKFASKTASRIGLTATYTSPSSKGEFALEVTVNSETVESNVDNNKDLEYIEYNNSDKE